MFFIKFLMLGIAVVAIYFLFRWASKAWKKADVEQKLEDVKIQDKVYKKALEVNPADVKSKKKAIDKIKDLDI